MDNAVVRWLQQQLEAPLQRQQAVGGGCIHNACCVELVDGRRWFVKTNRAAAEPLLAAEAEGLVALAAVAPPELQVPLPQACAVVGDQVLLLLPWLELDQGRGRERDAQRWQGLGRAVARLHRNSLSCGPGQGRFGWGSANFIGANPQPNGWQQHWGTFFAEQRFGFQLEMAARAGLCFNGGAQIIALAKRWLSAHSLEPVLVHGDLWSGNAALLRSGGATIFDPAVYRGDREVDLAMAHLFGGFPPAFFAGYEAEWPLPPGAEQRAALYNLYHLLNHANLFGGGYRRQAQQSIDRLLSLD